MRVAQVISQHCVVVPSINEPFLFLTFRRVRDLLWEDVLEPVYDLEVNWKGNSYLKR
jgi:hypothetical protein